MFRCCAHEATNVFYKRNPISLFHGDIYILMSSYSIARYEARLVRKALVVTWTESGPWMQCKSCSTNVSDFLCHFKFDNFGNHQRVTLDYPSFDKEFDEIRELLLQAEIHDFRPISTSVDYFTINTTKTVTLPNPDWALFNRLGNTTLLFYRTMLTCTRNCPLPELLAGIDRLFICYIRDIFGT